MKDPDNKQIIFTKAKNKYRERVILRIKRILSVVLVVGFILFSVWLTYQYGDTLVSLVRDKNKLAQLVNGQAFLSRVIFISLVMLQIFIAFIPGEPFEIAAGYVFGAWEGTLIILVGATLASIIIFLLVKKYGKKLLYLFISEKDMESVKFLNDAQKVTRLTFIVFLIPGTPKDVLTYMVGLTDMKLGQWLFITTVGRFPSIISSTFGGSLLVDEKYKEAALVFGGAVILALLGMYYYKGLKNRKNE